MSRGFVKEGDQEEILAVTPRAFLPPGIPNYVTPEGLEALRNEMKQLQDEYIEAEGDYLTRNHINAKMNLLQERINTAVEIDATKASTDTVGFGHYVRYNDKTVRIVGADEADFTKGLISFVSPIAKALTGKKQGACFEMTVPKGTERITIQEISATPLPLTALPKNDTPFATKQKNAPTKSASKPRPVNKQIETQKFEAENIAIKAITKSVFQPKENPMDFLPLVNERGNIVGHAQHCKIHDGAKLLHPAVHLLIDNASGIVVGRYWWHVAFGETPETTLKRRALEDLNLVITRPTLKARYLRETKTEKELVFCYSVVSEKDMIPSPDDENYLLIFEKDKDNTIV